MPPAFRTLRARLGACAPSPDSLRYEFLLSPTSTLTYAKAKVVHPFPAGDGEPFLCPALRTTSAPTFAQYLRL